MPCSLAKCGEIILSHLQYFCFCSSQGRNYFQKMKMENWYLTRWISVTHGRWVQGGENQWRIQVRGNLLHFFHLWEWAVAHQTQQFMNLRAAMLRLWGGNHCWNVSMEERNGEFWTMKTMHFPSIYVFFSFFYGGNGNSSIYVLTFFHFFLLILNTSSFFFFFQH